MQPDRKGRILIACISDHHNRIVDLHFNVHNGTIWHIGATRLPGIEGFLQEINDPLRPVCHDVYRDARIPLWSELCVHLLLSITVASVQIILRCPTTMALPFPARPHKYYAARVRGSSFLRLWLCAATALRTLCLRSLVLVPPTISSCCESSP